MEPMEPVWIRHCIIIIIIIIITATASSSEPLLVSD